MDVAELDYEHPERAIATRPAERRVEARLLACAAAAPLRHLRVADLGSLFESGELLVLNETRVRPGRTFGRKTSGARVELLVLERRGRAPDAEWLSLLRCSRSPRVGACVRLDRGPTVRVVGREGEAFVLRTEGDEDLEPWLLRNGRVPLPPYLGREDDAEDRERYQTVYAAPETEWAGASASAAAPTAGLHLSEALLRALEERGVELARLSLGVGAGTFRPVRTQRVEDHRMHEEPIEIPAAVARAHARARERGARITAVGTTTLRALEASATPSGRVRAGRARTGLFLLPGCAHRTTDRLLTNFHQPRSTLLALVQGYAGSERVRAAYREAIDRGYRLFSYGDAMLLERSEDA